MPSAPRGPHGEGPWAGALRRRRPGPQRSLAAAAGRCRLPGGRAGSARGSAAPGGMGCFPPEPRLCAGWAGRALRRARRSEAAAARVLRRVSLAAAARARPAGGGAELPPPPLHPCPAPRRVRRPQITHPSGAGSRLCRSELCPANVRRGND